jgi:hypothetical protein
MIEVIAVDDISGDARARMAGEIASGVPVSRSEYLIG